MSLSWRSMPGGRAAAVFLVALSLSIGWGIRGNFGHEAGAMMPGALAAIAACLLSGREDWRARVPYFALFGALGWAFGGSIAYMYCISFAGSEHWPTAIYGFFLTFYTGFLWAGMGGAGTALPAVMDRRRLTDFFVPLCFALFAVGLHALAEEPLNDWVQRNLSVGVDSTWNRHRHPLYWLDADWRPALAALLGVCAFDLWDRRFKGWPALLGLGAGGALLGWLVQAGLDRVGFTAGIARALTVPLADAAAVNPDTGQLFDSAQFLTNWPQIAFDYPQYIGLALGLIAGVKLYFFKYGAWRRDSGLLLYMSAGWLVAFLVMPVLGSILLQPWGGFRLMPPRSDDWAGITGVFVGMTLYCLRHGLAPVAWAASLTGIIGGFGFALVPFVRSLVRLPGHRLLTPGGTPPEWAHYQSANWHSILEQSQGFCHGVAIAVVLALLAARLPRQENTPRDKRWTEIFSASFLLFLIGWLNVVKNVSEWTGGGNKIVPETMKAPLLGIELGALTWFNLAWFAAAIAVTALMALHLRRRIEVIPASWIGKGQLLYLAFLWMVVVANHERALPNFSEGRLVTEWVILMNAALATFLICWLPGARSLATDWQPQEKPLLLRTLWARALPVVIVGMLFMAITTRMIYREHPTDHPSVNHKRFGEEAHWRIKPILKGGTHR